MRTVLLIGLSVGLATHFTGPAGAAESPASKGFQSTEGYGKTRWGMIRAEVKGIYPQLAPYLKDSAAVYQRDADKEAKVVFGFTKNRLTQVSIFVQSTAPDPERYLAYCEEMKRGLAERYGQPNLDTKDKAMDGGEEFLARWETEKTNVSLSCVVGPVFKLISNLYSSKELAVKKGKP